MGAEPTVHDEFFSDDRTASRDRAVALPEGGYEEFLFDRDDPVLTRYRGMRYDAYSADRVRPPFVQELLADWEALYREPFTGITSDGDLVPGLYELVELDDTDAALRASALRFLDHLTPTQSAQAHLDIDAPEWRAWSNPEFVIHRVGVRLEDLSDDQVRAALDMVEGSLSPEGYALVRRLMALNGFLGRLVDLPSVMNERSYSVTLFGDPVRDAPWGWQLFGHHVALNFVSVAGRHVIAPVFLGAEPALSNDGAPSAFALRESLALELVAGLDRAQRASAVVFASVLDPSMPSGRLHPADERHLAGAFHDNRTIPPEGLRAAELTEPQRAALRLLVDDALVLLRRDQRDLTLADYDRHVEDTWLSWYGPTDGSGPFYVRVQSPVLLTELDHHAGVWLTNRLPARFHVHTTLRLPNGNDYGRALISQWRAPRDDRGTHERG